MRRAPESREQHLRLEQELLVLAYNEECLHGLRIPQQSREPQPKRAREPTAAASPWRTRPLQLRGSAHSCAFDLAVVVARLYPWVVRSHDQHFEDEAEIVREQQSIAARTYPLRTQLNRANNCAIANIQTDIRPA